MQPILVVVRQDKTLIVKGRDAAAQVRPRQEVRRVVTNEADIAKRRVEGACWADGTRPGGIREREEIGNAAEIVVVDVELEILQQRFSSKGVGRAAGESSV